MKRYQIAGLQVEMEVSGRTQRQAEPYAVTAQTDADITLVVNSEQLKDIAAQFPDENLAEYMLTGTLFARKLLEFDGFQLHSSAVILDGKAYMFSAPSGTGKSTHTEKWLRLFGAQYLNDDKPVLRRGEDGWTAYGTPWSGKHDLSQPASAPVGGIAFLERGEENRIQRLEPGEAVPLLISQSLRYLNAYRMDLQLNLLDKLLREVPVWRLICRNDDDAALVSHKEMVK